VNGLFLGGGPTIVHPSEHTIFISYSTNVTVNGINVSTYGIHNADGIDLATTDTAYMFNSTFDTGDDCVNLNAGTSAPGVTENKPINNVRVFNVLTNRGHGGVVFGSFTGSDRGGGSTLVTARDITMTSIATDAILFDSNYPAGSHGLSNMQHNHINLTNVTLTKTKGASIDQFNTGVFTKLTFASNSQSTVWAVSNSTGISRVRLLALIPVAR